MVFCSVVQCSVVQYSIVQYSVVYCSIVQQCSVVQVNVVYKPLSYVAVDWDQAGRQQSVFHPLHEEVGYRGCHVCAHSRAVFLSVDLALEREEVVLQDVIDDLQNCLCGWSVGRSKWVAWQFDYQFLQSTVNHFGQVYNEAIDAGHQGLHRNSTANSCCGCPGAATKRGNHKNIVTP